MIDLRSDTVTQPTAEMLDAMRAARLGDDSRDGDPTVRELEALAAARTGKEAAIFVPSGTMGNLAALMAHTGRGGEVLLEESSHILKSEMGAIAQVAGLFHRTIRGDRGAMDLGMLTETINAQLKPNKLATALIEMETTHNGAGGAVLPLDHMAEVHALGRQHGIPVHTDGARLFNAAVALGVPAERIARHTDSVTFCVSKGLSAPIGSLLCGTEDFIVRARGFRRMLGGNLRQAGMLAAAGIVALDAHGRASGRRSSQRAATRRRPASAVARTRRSKIHRDQHRARRHDGQRLAGRDMVGCAAALGCTRRARRADAAPLRHPPAHLACGYRDDAAGVRRSVAQGARPAGVS